MVRSLIPITDHCGITDISVLEYIKDQGLDYDISIICNMQVGRVKMAEEEQS